MSYTTTTHSICVTVKCVFLEEHSSPGTNHYVWAYHIQIQNLRAEKVQLLSRHWEIHDGWGRQQAIHGEGVVGEQPVLQPGDSFEYTSGIPLSTPSGIMVGRYHMETGAGEIIEIQIPPFSLDSPHQPLTKH